MTTFLQESVIAKASETAQPTWDLHRHPNGRLMFVQAGENGDRKETPVQAACCFPWSKPHEYVSLRDDKGHELLLIEALEELPGAQRQLLEEELAARNFLPRVTRIDAITDQMEFFHWQVMTTAGSRSFLTRRHERPRQLANGQTLIKDICNDIYVIVGAAEMDPKSARLLWVYLD